MSRISNKLRLAMEELDQAEGAGEGTGEAAVVDIGEAAPGEGADEGEGAGEVSADEYVVSGDAESGDDTAEAAVADAGEAEAELDAVEDQTDQLEESAAGLEAIYDMLLDAQQKGGLNRQAAQAVSIAVEAYTKPLGYDDPIMPSLEHFGADTARLKATNLSLEGIKETLAKAWEAVKKFVIKIWDGAVNFIKRLFSAAERLKQRGERLSKIKLVGKAKSANIDAKGLARKLAVGTKVDLNPTSGMEAMTKLASNAAGNMKLLSSAGFDEIIASASNPAALDPKAPENKGMKKLIDQLSGWKKISGSEVYPGNVRIDVRSMTFGAVDRRIDIPYFTKTENADRVPDKATVPTMSPEAIRAAGAAAVKLYEAVSEAKTQSEALSKGAKGLKNIRVPDDLKDGQRKVFNDSLSLIRAASSTNATLSSKICAHCIKTGLTYLQLAERSAAQYKTAKSK